MKLKKSLLYGFLRMIAGPFIRLLFNLKIENKDRIPSSGKLIICANHSSLMDPLLLAVVQKRQVYYMAKIELFRNFLIGSVIKMLGAFPVSRGTQDKSAINTAQHVLKKEGILGIFLEGTRSKDGQLLRPKSGAAMLAYQTNTPILPVCINRVSGGPVRIFHRTTISIGQLILPKKSEKATRLDLKEMSSSIMEQISHMKNK